MLEITLFTDPACPFAFSAEPQRLRLLWHYGDGIEWRPRMIVLTLEPGEAERLAGGAPGLQRKYGMPINPAPAGGVIGGGLPGAGRGAPQRRRGRRPPAAGTAGADDGRRAARRS